MILIQNSFQITERTIEYYLSPKQWLQTEMCLSFFYRNVINKE
jgi:hypothetical protein